MTLTDPLWRRERKEPVFLFLPIYYSESWYKGHKWSPQSFFFFFSPRITLHNKIKLLQGNKAETVSVSTVFKRNGFCEGKPCLTHPPELPQDLPEVKPSLFQEEAIWIIGCNVPLQPYLLHRPQLQVNLLAKAGHTWPSHTSMLIFPYLNPAPSSTLGPYTSRKSSLSLVTITDNQSPNPVNSNSQVAPESTWCSSCCTPTHLVRSPHALSSWSLNNLDWTDLNLKQLFPVWKIYHICDLVSLSSLLNRKRFTDRNTFVLLAAVIAQYGTVPDGGTTKYSMSKCSNHHLSPQKPSLPLNA